MSAEQNKQADKAEKKQEQTPLQALRQQFAEELQRDSVTAQQLSEQLQQLANKREQLKGAIFAMDAAMNALQNKEAEANAAKAEETKEAAAEVEAKTEKSGKKLEAVAESKE